MGLVGRVLGGGGEGKGTSAWKGHTLARPTTQAEGGWMGRQVGGMLYSKSFRADTTYRRHSVPLPRSNGSPGGPSRQRAPLSFLTAADRTR